MDRETHYVSFDGIECVGRKWGRDNEAMVTFVHRIEKQRQMEQPMKPIHHGVGKNQKE